IDVVLDLDQLESTDVFWGLDEEESDTGEVAATVESVLDDPTPSCSLDPHIEEEHVPQMWIDSDFQQQMIESRKNDIQRAIIYTDDIRDQAVTSDKIAKNTIDASRLRDSIIDTK